ncbi:peptidyl-prolyl cis-trans isomerase [bacterium]|nr:peptidyl-prolyl cis-trans isomerase [bacterium]
MKPASKNDLRALCVFAVKTCVLALALSACGTPPPPAFPEGVLALVNGEAITEDEFFDAFREARAGNAEVIPDDVMTRLQLKTLFLAELVEGRLVAQQAGAHKIAVEPAEIDARVAKLAEGYPADEFDRLIAARQIDRDDLRRRAARQLLVEKITDSLVLPRVAVVPAEIEAEYQLRADRYREPERVRAAQILVAGEAEAEKLVVELYGGADFAALARQHSIAPEAARGGDLGWFARHEMPPEIAKTAFEMAIGQTSGVVRTSYGAHVIRVLDRRAEGVVPLDKVRDEIRADIRRRKAAALYDAWVDKVRAESDIRYNQERLVALPLQAQPATGDALPATGETL